MLNRTSNLAPPTMETTWRIPQMKKIPKKGDVMLLGEKRFLVTEVQNDQVYSAKRLQTMFIPFSEDESLEDRRHLIRDTMKDRLPIELIDVTLHKISGDVGYGHDQDLLEAISMTIIYTK